MIRLRAAASPAPPWARAMRTRLPIRGATSRLAIATSGLAIVACAASLAVSVSAALAAAVVTTLDAGGAGVSAYGGWAAWTHIGPGANEYQLMLRSPLGAVSAAPVPAANGVFDVQLGPAAGGGVDAVYQRCADPAHARGCQVFVLPLGHGAGERRLVIPGGGSDLMPAVWKGRIAFVRSNPAGGRRRPDNLLTWTIGAAGAQAVTLPVSRGGRESGGGHWPKGLTGTITSLALGPSQLSYVTSNQVGSFGETTLWYQPLGGRPELIDQQTSGAGNVCQPSFLSPVIAGRWLYAYLHACDPSGNPALDRLTRYRHGLGERARYTFVHGGDDDIGSVVPDGAGVDWADEGVRNLAAVTWRRIPLPVAQTFCSRADPFC